MWSNLLHPLSCLSDVPPEREKLFCAIRQQWVAAAPEEMVRQAMIRHMVEERGFPKSLLSVEKALADLADSLLKRAVPKRRIDLAAFCLQGAELLPLLLVECKAVPLTHCTIQQLAGYNHFVRAPFICMVNHSQMRLCWQEEGNERVLEYLPHYEELVKRIGS